MNLTKPQKLIYDMERVIGQSINVICGCMLLPGAKSEADLTAAVNRVYQLNDALRIRIGEEYGRPSQQIIPYAEKNIEVLHFNSKAELDFYAQNHATVPFDFYGDLFDIKVLILPEQYGLLVKFHHIVGDAWTIALVGTQFNTIMNGEEPSACSYCEYVESEKEYLESQRYENDRTFFLEQFKKCDEVTYLSEKQASSYSATRKAFVLDAEKTQQIKDYAIQNKTSAYALFMTVLAAYMNRTKMNVEKFYLGTAVLNRSGAREKRTMGMFVNTVPMLMEMGNEKSFAENLATVGKTIFSAFRHQKFNYGDVLASIRKEHNFTEKLYDVMLSYQNATITGGDCETTWYHCGTQNESLQIHIDDRDNEGVFRIHYDYQTEKFSSQEVESLHQHLMTLLLDAIANDSKTLYELDLLTPKEQQKVLYDFNDTAVYYPKDKCIYRLFEEQGAINPNKTAVIFKDTVLSYAELTGLVQDYSNKLKYLGVGEKEVVAIHLERSHKLIAFQLAVLKIGAVFLPVDKRYPLDRITYMCNDCSVQLLISDELSKNDIKTNIFTLGEFETITASNTAKTIHDTDVCYIIYTSGSTGMPKGCMLTGQGLLNFCKNNNTLETLNGLGNCVFGCVNSVSFDYFIAESLLPLTNGFTTVILDDAEGTSQEQFLDAVSKNDINVVMTTPTRLKIYFDDKRNCDALGQLRCICTSGEPLTPELLEQMYQKSPDAQVYNPIGPSECSVWDVGGKLKRSEGIDIHIGKPIANTQIYIVDKFINVVPIGVTGELCIAGAGVGAGYLNRPELTAEKFIDNPFGTGKLYKTGDLAYWRKDGNIAYVGRNDFQVKIRGLRIELGEIENVICGIQSVSQAVVVVRKNSSGRQLICAFYTGTEREPKEIRNHIGKKLPKYMLPHILTYLSEMPLTSSGKVNRKALPDVDLENITNDAEYVAPENMHQQKLCELMQQVLEVSPVGIADDFFDLGGDSLKAIELVSEAHNEGIYINLQDIYDHPTVKQLWDYIAQGEKQRVSFDDADFTAVNAILAKNKPEYIVSPQQADVGNLLLAGATGYLGIHILADFLEHDKGTAYCLVRGKDVADSKKRLYDLLNFYFGERFSVSNRIEIIGADLQKDNFGLTDEEYQALLSKVDTVINAAASVKHYGVYQYFYEVNVESVKRLITFCKQSNAKLIHTSTLAVSGNGFDSDLVQIEKRFTESDLYIGQPLKNVYARSKFEAEKVVLEAMSNGLQANIMRMGNLTNRASDGVFQKNYESNAFLKRITSLVKLGVYPGTLSDVAMEFTPIDEAAAAIMTIARRFSSERIVFHISNPDVITLSTMFNLFSQLGIEVKGVDATEFDHYLQTVTKQEGMEGVLDAFVNDFDGKNELSYDSKIRIENDFTVQYLKALGFEWADIGMDYLRKYVEYFRKIGYMEV